MEPFVRIIVVNYDGGEVTLRCLRSLVAMNWPAHRREIILVDNASIDGLTWKVPRLFPEVRVIESLTNEGFARGNNLALSNLDNVDVVCLLNNDAWVEPNWLEKLIEVLQTDEAIGVACPKMLFAAHAVGIEIDPGESHVCLTNVKVNGRDELHNCEFDERFDKSGIGQGSPTPQHWVTKPASVWLPIESKTTAPLTFSLSLFAPIEHDVRLRTVEGVFVVQVGPEGGTFDYHATQVGRVVNNAGSALFSGWTGGDIGFKELDLGQHDQPSQPFAFCGGAVAMKSDFLKDVGLFDPTYFLYYEDLDLAWRGHFHGWTYKYVPTSVVYHEHAFSSVEGSAFFNFWVDRNRRLTLVKNAPAKVAMRAVLGSIVWGVRDSIMPVLRALRHRRRLPIRTSSHRFRQMLSLLKGLPPALRERRRLGKIGHVPRSFAVEWLVER